MAGPALATGDRVVLEREDFPDLLAVLRGRGFRVVGPTLRQGDLVLDELASAADLPAGWTDVKEAGSYRLQPRADEARFGYGVGQHSWKPFLFPPRYLLWQGRREKGRLQTIPGADDSPPQAFLGVRPCDLHAIEVQDRVFLKGGFVDPVYRQRRERAFIVAINCGQPCATGFCASMGTGPRAASGFDLALTEIISPSRHDFLVEVGTAKGAKVLQDLPHRGAEPQEVEQGEALICRTAAQMGRKLDTVGIKELLYGNYEHPRWDDVAARCLSCGNCAWVCPTCFCHTLEDLTDLTGSQAERWRRMDVCFTVDFSYLHGGSIRPSPRSRYRQWLTHKLATWIDQFGCSGCVGCGRCITWCPVGIDITEEVRAIRESQAS